MQFGNFYEAKHGIKPCPKCGDKNPEHRELRNYDMAFHEGDIHCTECGAYVRMFDAG